MDLCVLASCQQRLRLQQDYGAVPSALVVNENTFALSISPAAVQVPPLCLLDGAFIILWRQGQPAEWEFIGDDSLQQVRAAVCVALQYVTMLLAHRRCWRFLCVSTSLLVGGTAGAAPERLVPCHVTCSCSCSIDARYYLGDPVLHVTGCIPRDAPPSIQVAAAIKADAFASSLFAAALNQAGVAVGSISSGSCADASWSWGVKHSSLALSTLMNHTLQQR